MTPDIREILEEYKKMIHGSEFDFHRQIQSLKEHEESMDRAKEITRIAIDSAYKKWFMEIVGEDKKVLISPCGENDEAVGYNTAKAEIRERIK